MAHPQLRAVSLALALTAAGCDSRGAEVAQASVTVKLPPARARTAAPAFSFKAQANAPQSPGPAKPEEPVE